MSNNILNRSPVSVPRAALQGYLVMLLGLLFVVQNASTAATTGLSLSELGGLVLGLLAIGGGAYGYFRPDEFPRGTEPAPTYLYILVGGATLTFVVALISLIA